MEIYPKDGLTYKEAQTLWGCTMKEAITRLNNLVVDKCLIRGGERNGLTFWVEEPPELEAFVSKGAPGKTTFEKTCPCGKKFKTKMKQKIYCGPVCNSHYSQVKRSERKDEDRISGL